MPTPDIGEVLDPQSTELARNVDPNRVWLFIFTFSKIKQILKFTVSVTFVTFQALQNHMGLVATALNSRKKHLQGKFHWRAPIERGRNKFRL